jgi:CheY-like chemotaxis protein
MPAKKKILVVDDDEIQLIMTEGILKNEYEIISVKSGKEALNLILHGSGPNLILLDILMPNMDGWETFNRLKAVSCLRDIPIVFLTSVHDTKEVDRAHAIGAADYITKPYEGKNLLERIEKVLTKND